MATSTDDLAGKIFSELPDSGFLGPLHTTRETTEAARAVLGKFLPELVNAGALGREILTRVTSYMREPNLVNKIWADVKEIEAAKKLDADGKSIRGRAKDGDAALRAANAALEKATAARDKAASEATVAARQAKSLDEAEKTLAAAKKSVLLRGLLKGLVG